MGFFDGFHSLDVKVREFGGVFRNLRQEGALKGFVVDLFFGRFFLENLTLETEFGEIALK
jgi:hypothetical protein